MAHTITGASLDEHTSRLSSVDNHHPFDAQTFCDWATQAGDIVTVTSENQEYASPLYNTKTVWRGRATMGINCGGTKEQGPISKLSRDKFRRGGTAVRSEERIYREFTSSDGMLHSAIYMSECILRTEFDSAISDVHSSIEQTAEHIYSEVYASESMVFSYVEQTATSIASHVESVISGVGSEILQTACEIRAEVHASNSLIYSYIDQTATSIRSEVASAESQMGSMITQTASQIRTDVYAANSQIYSYVDQTASSIKSSVNSVESRLGSQITQTASQIRTDVYAANSQIYSYVDQTASSIKSSVNSVESRLGSQITQTASQIRTDVYAANSQIYSYVDQTASSIKSSVNSVESRMSSQIVQTASQIRSDVSAADSAIYSTINQTAYNIRQQITSTASNLQSSIDQTANKVDVIVAGTGANAYIKPAAIQAAINAASGQSKITLSADHIILDGDTVVGALVGKDIRATGLTATYVNATSLSTNQIECDYGTVNPNRLFVTAYVEDNVLHLMRTNGDEVTFSKATQLSGSWSGATFPLTVNAKQQNGNTETIVDSYTVGFGGPNTDYDIKLELSSNGNATVDPTFPSILIVPVKVAQVQSIYSTPFTRYEKNISIGTSGLLQQKTVTENGEVTADSGYIGLSKVTVNVESVGDITLSGSWTGSTFTAYSTPAAQNEVSTTITSEYQRLYGVEFIVVNAYDPATQRNVTVSQNTIALNTGSVDSTTGKRNIIVVYKGSNTGLMYECQDYKNAWEAAYGKVVWPTAGTANSYIQIYAPDSTIGSDTYHVYALFSDEDYVYLKRNGDTYARVANNGASTARTNGYNAGWGAAYDSVYSNYPTSEDTTNNYISIPKPNSTVDGSPTYYKYYVVGDSTGIYIKFSTVAGTKVAKADITLKPAETYYTSLSTQSIAAGQYLTGAQSIAAVSTSNIAEYNIKYGVTVKVGDSGDAGRIKNVTGTFTSSSLVSTGQTAASASQILSGYSAWVDGAEVKGSITSKAAATYYTSTSTQSIAAGQYLSGAQSIAAVSTSNIAEYNIKYGVTVKVGDSGNTGRIKNVTGTFTSSSLVSTGQTAASASQILSGYSAWVNGAEVKGSIASKAAATYYTSTSTQSIAAGQYLSGAQSIAAVSTSNISAANIKYNVTVKVGDSGNTGRIANVTGTFTSDGTAAAGDILSGKIAYVKGSKITGTISSKAAETYYTSTSTQSIAAGQYLTGAQSIAAVSTSNIAEYNIKYGVTVKVGDSGNTGRIKNVTGTFTSSSLVSTGQTAASASQILSGYSAWVNGAEVKGSIASKAAATIYPKGTSQTIAAGQYLSGAQTIGAVTTTNLSRANIKHNVTVSVGNASNSEAVTTVVGTFTSDGTATASEIASGKIAYVKGSKITGTMSTQAATTIHPTTSTQTIAAGKYLSGAITFLAVSTTNLTADNIKNGVTVKIGDSTDASYVKSVTGTYEPSTTVTNIELWPLGGSSKCSAVFTVTGTGKQYKAWCKVNGTWKGGETYTINGGGGGSSGSVTPSVAKMSIANKNNTPDSYAQQATLISGLLNIGSGKRVVISVYGTGVTTKYWYFET